MKLLLLGNLLATLPLALASPPDDVWLNGVYDGADLDDAMLALTSLVVAKQAVPKVKGPMCTGAATPLAKPTGFAVSVQVEHPPLAEEFVLTSGVTRSPPCR